METSEPPLDPTIAHRQEELDQQAVEIAAIVDRDRRRRRRTLRTLFILLIITAALAAVVLAFGRSDQQVLRDTAAITVAQQVPNIVESKVNEKAPSLISGEVNKQLSSPLLDQKLNPMVTTAVNSEINDQVYPKISSLEDRLASLKSAPNPPFSNSPGVFTNAEVRDIKAISRDLPNRKIEFDKLSYQVKQLVGASTSPDGSSWNKDKPEIGRRLGALDGELKASRADFAKLSQKIDAILEHLDDARNPCSSTAQTQPGPFLTYSVKENSTADIYDLRLQVVLKNARDGIVHGLTVYGDGVVIFGPKDVPMGAMVGFEEKKSRYFLVPIFVNRRFLANDFVGLGISRARKCPNNSEQ